ncbi:MAG TPA: hypothetical protein VJ691_06380 [Vicinamibacterales bacterium]|nr:hypothetical protein [Vicinamibacterales bacterium]
MNDNAPPKKRTWVWVVVGVFFVLVVLAIAGITISVAFFRQSMTVTAMSSNNATEQFDAVRARYPGQQPLIQMVDDRPQFIADRATKSGAVSTSLKTMHVMAWDEDEEQLVTFSLPFWVLRLKSGPIRLSAYSQGWDDRGVSFRIEDLERAGPGIVLDFTERREGRVLVWAE